MFTHLHVSSAYSAHYGVDWPETIALAAAADGATAVAVTDRDGLYGGPKHVAACLEAGIDPILGVDLAIVTPEGVPAGRVVVLAHGHDGGAGYAALCRLISAAHTRTHPAVTVADLARHLLTDAGPVGTVLLGPWSDVGQAEAERAPGRARKLLHAWRTALSPQALAVEVVTHLTEPGTPLSHARAVGMLRLARATWIRAVLSNAVRYVEPDGALTADVLDAARTLTTLSDAPVQANAQGWFKPAAAMARLAAQVADTGQLGRQAAAELLADTEAVADQCRLDPVKDMGWGVPTIPEPSVLGITGDPMKELWDRAHAGLIRRYGDVSLDVESRLLMEMGVIEQLGFGTYFLTVAEVTRLIREMGIRSAARGSGAGSLVNYALGISQVDPVHHDLLFERFLSLHRTTLPDIDIDVESARRHDVYHRIFQRFGQERVTLMSMQSGYRARGAARDAGLALGMPEQEIDDVAKSLWRFSASQFREAMTEKPELRDLARRVEDNRQLDLLVDITERLDRLPRHISMHPCGVILGDATLLERTPVQPSGLGLPMSQFDKHDMDPMGLIKIDVLGVRMKSSMAYAVAEIKRLHGTDIDLDAVPLDDPATFELIRSTHTLGCFQIESPGQRELLGKLQPEVFDDLITDISLFRPGPMQADMVRPFLSRRAGFEPVETLHPDLEPVLRNTHGIVVFHEQVMRILDVMTGCGYATADVYRRWLSGDEQPKVEEFFRAKAAERGYNRATIDKVWDVLKGFGSFGFCRAHGAAFAVPTYQSAWLKAHYPAEFLAGIWTHDPGMYPLRLLVSEARRIGIPILPLDVNHSTDQYRVQPAPDGRLGIRLSLADVRGIHAAEVQRIIAGQPYDSLTDLKERARLRTPTLESLARVGALDSLYQGRDKRSRYDLIDRVRSTRAAKRGHEPIPGQLALPLPALDAAYINPAHGQMSTPDTIRAELDVLTFDATEHVMKFHAKALEPLGITQAKDLLSLRSGTEVTVAGIRVATQTPPMRGGKRVVFISIDDGTGCIDATFFHDVQEKVASPVLFNAQLLVIRGKTRRTGAKGISLQAEDAWELVPTEPEPQPREAGWPGATSTQSLGSVTRRRTIR